MTTTKVSELKRVLMDRDGMTSDQADRKIARAKKAIWSRLNAGKDCEDFMGDYFGLEPDYLDDIL